MRNAMRMLKEAVARNEAITEEQVSSLYKLVDKGLKKGILKLNAVRRLKSRFASALPERFR